MKNLLLSAFAAATMMASAQAQILTYNLGTGTALSTPSTDTISTYSGGSLAFVNFTALGGASGYATSSQSSTYTLDASGTSVPASANYNFAANQLVAGGLNLATSSYIEFTLTPEAGSQVVVGYIGFGARVLADTAAATGYTVRSSLDGYASSVVTQSFTQSNSWTAYQNTVSLSGAVDQAVTLRIYFYGSDGTSRAGNTRLDDLTVTAVPEPSTYALLALGGVAVVVAMRRRRAQA